MTDIIVDEVVNFKAHELHDDEEVSDEYLEELDDLKYGNDPKYEKLSNVDCLQPYYYVLKKEFDPSYEKIYSLDGKSNGYVLKDQVHDEEVEDEDFSPLLVSTTTVTSVLKSQINIVDVAKYLPLDDCVIGIKLVYAGGASTIIRGVAKMSKKKKDFYNQVTFTIRLPLFGIRTDNKTSILVSCKIFHNGTLHITGSHDLDEAKRTANLLLERLIAFKGARMISLKPDVPFLNSHDHLLYSTSGYLIGWSNDKFIYLVNEYVVLDNLIISDCRYPVFVSSKWIDNKKTIYNLDGAVIGNRYLSFNMDIAKRHFDVQFGCIYSGKNIVGKEKVEFSEDYLEKLQSCELRRLYLQQNKAIVHCFSAFPNASYPPEFNEGDFIVHMINTFFKAPFSVSRNALHATFLNNGYYSRFDPCSNAAVNLRFHYSMSSATKEEDYGKCTNVHTTKCGCKQISVSCFKSGKMNVTGLATIKQGHIVYNFIKRFFIEHKERIKYGVKTL